MPASFINKDRSVKISVSEAVVLYKAGVKVYYSLGVWSIAYECLIDPGQENHRDASYNPTFYIEKTDGI